MALGRPKGTPKTGGRKKGSLNKRRPPRQETVERAMAEVMPKLPAELRDMTPLELLLLAAHWSIQAKDRAGLLAAAAAAAPYCHPRLAIADVRVTQAPAMSEEQLAIEIAELERKIADAKRLN